MSMQQIDEKGSNGKSATEDFLKEKVIEYEEVFFLISTFLANK